MENMGNFKGVMLCNRPAQPAPVPTAFDDSKRSAKAAFCSTVTRDEQLGSNPIKREFPARKKKDESNDVTWRHKRWLAEFQERRNELAEMLEENQVIQEERTRNFQDKQADMRATIRKCRDQNPGDKDAMKAALDNLQATENLSKTTKKTEKLKGKPKWAMNAEENEAVEDLEVDDLMDFTENLDFEAYMEGLEVKESMDFVNDRLKELATPKIRLENEDEEGEGDEEEEDRLTSLRDDGKKRKQENEDDWENSSQLSTAESVASKILESNKGMKGVHSQASVKAMLAQAQSLAVTEPTIATNKDRNNATVGTSNLPYLFRSPQI